MTDKTPPSQVIVVEGKCDTNRLKEVYGPMVKTIETKGIAIDQEVLNRIKTAQEKYGVIVLTDPDYPGKRIRQIIKDHVPQASHAYLSQDQTQSKHQGQSLGVEHASPQAIKEAIDKAQIKAYSSKASKKVELIPMSKLIKLGLAASPSSQEKRNKVSRAFNLGHLNAKQLQKELYRYQIGYEDLVKVLEEGE